MKKQRKNRYLFGAGLGIFVCLVFLSGLPVKRYGMKEPQKAYESQEVQEVSASLVQIRAGESSGSGVIYGEQDENLIILTAGHVLEQAGGEIQTWFQDGFTAKSSVYWKAEHADMAFIRVPFSEISPENAEGYTPVRTDKKAYDALQKGDRILVRKAEHADMAFIRVPFSEISPENAEGYTPVRTDKKAYDALQKGDRILVTGKEWDGTVSASWGVLEEPWIYAEDFDQHMMLVRGTAGHGIGDRILVTGKEWDGTVSASWGVLEEPWIYAEDFDQHMMLVRGTAGHGMSGGGVFDEAGNLIGILCGKSMAENAAEGESAGSIGEELAVLPLGVIAAGYQEMFLNKDP